MSVENDNRTAQRRLTSWKEIAAYVGRNERTVKRWEASRGLPVRRVAGATRGSVFAYADEIETWMRGHEAGGDVKKPSLLAPEPEQAPGTTSKRYTFALLLLAVATAVVAFVYFGQRQSSLPAAPQTSDPVAANLYRAGLHAWQTRTPSGLNRAISQFRQAITRDPRFAEAYVGLADAYDLQGEFTAAPRDRDYPKAAETARQAIALDPSLAGAHAALAFAEFYGSRDVRAAENEFRRAIALDPRSAVAHHWYATFLLTIGSFSAALAEIDKAESLDAESAAIPADKALILYQDGKKADAVRLLGQLEEDNPTFASPHKYLAMIHLADNDDAGFVRELKLAALTRRDEAGKNLADAAAKGLANSSRNDMLHSLLAAQQALFRTNQVSAYSLAQTCAALGDEKCAKSYLTVSVNRQEADNIAIGIDPLFTQYHNTTWFPAALAQAGLPSSLSSMR